MNFDRLMKIIGDIGHFVIILIVTSFLYGYAITLLRLYHPSNVRACAFFEELVLIVNVCH